MGAEWEDVLACGCPSDTPVRQVSACEMECLACGLITA